MKKKLTLNQLLANYLEAPHPQDCEITGLSLDTRTLSPGSLFFACPGSQNDGREFISEAIAKGAAAIAIHRSAHVNSLLEIDYPIPVVTIPNLKHCVSEIASRFYGDPSQEMFVIGVTGTNGKTSVSHFLTQCAHKLGNKAAMIGTLGYGLPKNLIPTLHTTPDAIEIQRIFSELREQGVQWVVMEVSSHGLDQGRVNGISFDHAIFTNLSRDHLDYHATMEDYGQAKAKLFSMPTLKRIVINSDDEFGWSLIQSLQGKTPAELFSYSAQGHLRQTSVPCVRAQHAHLSLSGITASLISPWGDTIIHSQLLGHFSLSNLLAVYTTLAAQKITNADILKVLPQLTSVPGRMEVFGGIDQQPKVIVDFAHTPDALKQVLTALREHAEGKLWCVFGCGGNRDAGKRAEMGRIAEIYADCIVLTNDNPRHEDPAEIMTMILLGMTQPSRAVVEYDRARAIAHAIQSAGTKDIVLIAGKGHEAYQLIGNQKIPFSDAINVQLCLSEHI
jgi:UDP-N-acetylmuramoyl-L-alanyl-D-glutamate--2,6-diaminopimelate ligase